MSNKTPSARRRPRNLVARALAAHSALGIGAAALVYMLAVTGAIAVFNRELQRWEQPGAPEFAAIAPAAAAQAAHDMLAREPAATEHLFIHLPSTDLPRVVLTTDSDARFATADGTLSGKEHHPWTQFLLDLHFYLHLPQVPGLTLVGAVGVLLASLAITGFVGHARLVRDAFALRLGRHPRLTQTDWHNRLAVWTSPFLVSIALTGAVLGLATLVASGIAALDFDGDTEAAFAQVFGAEPTPDSRPAALPDIARALTVMQREYPAQPVTYVIVHEPLTRGQHLRVLADHPERLIFGEYYTFSDAGEFKGAVGMAGGTVGQQMVASAYKLHFGSFGGLPVKLLYSFLGLALAVITCSGMRIFFLRRRERGHALLRFEGAWSGLTWGLPGALAAPLLLALGNTGTDAPLPAVFWTTLASFVGVGYALGATQPNAPARIAHWSRMPAGLLIAAASLTHYGVHAGHFVSPAAHGVFATQIVVAVVIGLPPMLRLRYRRRHVEPCDGERPHSAGSS